MLGTGSAQRAPVVPVADHCAEHHGKRRRHRQIDADADRERRQAQQLPRAKQFIDDHNDAAQTRANAEHQPVQLLLDDALRECRNQSRLRGRERFRHGSRDMGRTDKAVRLRQQIEHRRYHGGARDDADDERPLLRARCRTDELTGLQILEVVVRDRGDAKDHRGREQRIRDKRATRRSVGRHYAKQQRSAGQDRKNADTRNRAVGCADEPRHVAADRRHHETAEEHERHRRRDKRDSVVRKRRRGKEARQHERNHHEAGEREHADPARGHANIAAIKCRRFRGARGGDGGCESTRDGPGKFQQCPDRSDADGARADEAHLMRPHVRRAIGDRPGRRRKRCQQRNRTAPSDQKPKQHRHADGESDEVAGAQQRERERHVVAADRARADAEELRHFTRRDACRGEDRESRRGDGAPGHREQALPRFP